MGQYNGSTRDSIQMNQWFPCVARQKNIVISQAQLESHQLVSKTLPMQCQMFGWKAHHWNVCQPTCHAK